MAPTAPTPATINAAPRPTVASQSANAASMSDALKSRLNDVLCRVEGIGGPLSPATQNVPNDCINYSLTRANDNLTECHALLSQIEAALGG